MYLSWLFVALMAVPMLRECAPMRVVQAIQAAQPVMAGPTSFKSVLVAGDDSLPVFDNAVKSVRGRLRIMTRSRAVDMQRLSATDSVIGVDGVRPAVLTNLLTAIATMKPERGQGCFVFATSHGTRGRGLWLAESDEYLTPRALDRALTQGCGDAPTVVVISGCFSGIFAQYPMTRANRVVLTAANAYRTSFGCGAGRVYTVYDKCFLDALDAGGTWPKAYASVQACVAKEESIEGELASFPQAWFGSAVANMALPSRAVD